MLSILYFKKWIYDPSYLVVNIFESRLICSLIQYHLKIKIKLYIKKKNELFNFFFNWILNRVLSILFYLTKYTSFEKTSIFIFLLKSFGCCIFCLLSNGCIKMNNILHGLIKKHYFEHYLLQIIFVHLEYTIKRIKHLVA